MKEMPIEETATETLGAEMEEWGVNRDLLTYDDVVIWGHFRAGTLTKEVFDAYQAGLRVAEVLKELPGIRPLHREQGCYLGELRRTPQK